MLVAAGLAATSVTALAQPDNYPSRPITMVVPFPAGGLTDVPARLAAAMLQDKLGQGVVLENRTGGSGVIGAAYAARAVPDGYTLFANSLADAQNLHYLPVTYSPVDDFVQIGWIVDGPPLVLIIDAKLPHKTVVELVADAKANPGKITFASGGPATSLHVAIEVLRLASKIDTNYVPYGGSGPAINALMGGHVQAVWADYPTVVSQLKGGTLRALVTTSPKRIDQLPGVPTLTETGIVKYEAEIFYGIVAPAKTPPDVLKSTAAMLTKAMNTPEMKEKFALQGLFPDGTGGDKFGAFLRDITADYERITTAAGIKPN
jgi:tripartite-type tricarboxylate transporter receptor subunit TctC